MSNLVDHARRELELVGEDSETIEGLLQVIQAFADMGHSGGSAAICISWVYKLLQFQNITPLTNRPDEWMKVADDMWQSTRRADAFSTDGGRTYYHLEDGTTPHGHPRITYTAEEAE